VAGVGAALVSGNDIEVFRQGVHYFALALIAPLNTYDHNIG
jgi:hypothetical protein